MPKCPKYEMDCPSDPCARVCDLIEPWEAEGVKPRPALRNPNLEVPATNDWDALRRQHEANPRFTIQRIDEPPAFPHVLEMPPGAYFQIAGRIRREPKELTPADVLADLFASEQWDEIANPTERGAEYDNLTDPHARAALVLQRLLDAGFKVTS